MLNCPGFGQALVSDFLLLHGVSKYLSYQSPK